MQVKIKKLNPDAVIPKYGKPGDAALDLTATSYEFKDGRHVYGTGLAFEIPSGYVGLVFPRSSICKYDLRLTNSVGVIDSGYRGEVKAVFENDMMYKHQINQFISSCGTLQETQCVHKIYQVGERIAQILIIPYPEIELVESELLSETERGEGGFGSTNAGK